jgi:hypothetical protein
VKNRVDHQFFNLLQVIDLERKVAERVGFEPTVELPPLRFSSPLRTLRLIRTY